MQLPYFDGARLRAELDVLALVDDMRSGHREAAPEMERVYLTEPGTDNGYLIWHAWAPGSMIVTKMGTIFPGNLNRVPSRPSVQCIIAVFSGTDGSPMALIDGTELTYWKTAADSALAASYLARSDASTLLIVGAGGLAPYLAMGHRAVRPSIERVLVWNRSRHRAEEVATNPMLGDNVTVVDDLDIAVEQADVISCATATTVPLIHGARLRSGTHLDLVGGYTPDMRESDDDTARRARLFVDSARFNIDACGDLCQPIASGLRSRDDVEADLFDLCRGDHPGRTSPDEITLFKSGGGAHLDLMASRHVMTRIAS